MSQEPNDPRSSSFESFAAFYPAYLERHRDQVSRRLHFTGTSLALVALLLLALTGNPAWFFAALVCGYGFPWIGHALFERNAPATFKHPFYSLAADFRMWFEMLTGKVPF
jgi:hypothetical protein